MRRASLRPPWLGTSAEIGFGPRVEHDVAVLKNVGVCESETKRSGTTNDLSGLIVLRTVARADEFLRVRVPRNDTAEMCANGAQTIALQQTVFFNYQIGGVAFEALSQGAVSGLVIHEILLSRNWVSESIASNESAAPTSGAGRCEEKSENAQHLAGRESKGAEQKEVHRGALSHIRHFVRYRRILDGEGDGIVRSWSELAVAGDEERTSFAEACNLIYISERRSLGLSTRTRDC
mmetsp:Transcript_36250/g.58592  ORF Transcript_36250/g.58592 Transcript_36250/m.58592 type:complete len:235 (+) Transcript_36250:392-1096(+)